MSFLSRIKNSASCAIMFPAMPFLAVLMAAQGATDSSRGNAATFSALFMAASFLPGIALALLALCSAPFIGWLCIPFAFGVVTVAGLVIGFVQGD